MANVPVWEDGDTLGLQTLKGEIRTEVCVVGLGGSGLAAVGELLRLGRQVVGIDAGSVAGGAAGRNGGFLLAGMAPFYHEAARLFGRGRARQIYTLTIAEIDRIAQETPDAVRRVGSLRLAASAEEEEDCWLQYRAMCTDALPVKLYRGAEGQGLLIPTDGSFHPLRRCRTLATRALAAGARLFENSPAVEVEGTRVTTPQGTVHCEQVVVAIDGGLEQLLPELAPRVRTVRLQMLGTAPTDEISIPRPVYARWGFEYWQQLPDRRIALGGFRDLGGAEEWTTRATPGGRVQQELEVFLRERLHVQAPITHRWAATVGFSSTELPILEEVRPGVWAVGGYSGTGNVLGSLCGRAAAQLAVCGQSALAAPFLDRSTYPPGDRKPSGEFVESTT